MQLIIITLTFFFLVLSTEVKAQFKKLKIFDKQQGLQKDTTEIVTESYEDTDWKKIDMNFLSSYYSQDGNNSPVTGGLGTEALTDFTQKITLSIPMNKKLTMNIDGGFDYYTSASTDNIDNIQSGASGADARIHGNVGLVKKLDDQQTLGFRIGGSGEYDYTSVNGGVNYSRLSKNKNSQFDASAQAFVDNWSLIYPTELRRDVALLPSGGRNSFNAALGFAQVINKRLQVKFMLEATYMTGLLSTPFHRVFFQEQTQAKIERLPSTRLKIPIAVRANVHLSEKILLRSYYRFYFDDWGVQAHTASIEIPIKINRFFSIYPFYRYHQQQGSTYFKPIKEHNLQDEFYTSDYDLATLSSQSYGLGLSITPVDGIFKIKGPFRKKTIELKSLDLKYSHYDRSTGLKANVISLGLGFRF